jgi:hypothetical protein
MKAVRSGSPRERERTVKCTFARARVPFFSSCARRKLEPKWIGAVNIVRFEPNRLLFLHLSEVDC